MATGRGLSWAAADMFRLALIATDPSLIDVVASPEMPGIALAERPGVS
jgi:hypothetical protein